MPLNIILTIFFCLCFGFLSWQKLNWTLAFLVLALPAYLIRFQIFGVPFTLLEAMIWIVFLVWFVKNFKKETVIVAYRTPIILLLLISAIAIEISPNTLGALGIWKAYFLAPIMFFLVFINAIKSKKNLMPIVYALGVSALAVSVLAIYQKFTGWLIPNEFWQAEATRRVTSFFGYPNAIGLYLGPIIILYAGQLLGWLKSKNIWLTIFGLTVIIASILSIIFAVSEGALIGLFAGLIFFGWFLNQRSRIITLAIVAILTILIWLMPNISQPIYQEISFQGTSGKIRTEMWKETIQMLKDRPVFGAGLAGYQQTFDSYHQARHIEVYLYPHNIILNFWSELGLIGLAIFGFLGYNFFRQGWQLRKRENVWVLTLMAIMATIIVHGLVDVPYFKNDLAVMFWLWLGMMEVLKK